MEIYALVGKSGTGKSHHAGQAARSVGAEAIIDDGLLIISNKIAAGYSAKKEKTKYASVKRALFFDTVHAREVMNAIEKYRPKSILILGTSEEMARRIAETLMLSEIKRFIHIEEVSTPEDIERARNCRMKEGKHIIPVPTLEIKKDFSGYFMHPLNFFYRNRAKGEDLNNKTVVRPTYSYIGSFAISDNVLRKMAVYCAKEVEGVVKINFCEAEKAGSSVRFSVAVSLKYGESIPHICKKITENIVKKVEMTTSINVLEVNIIVKNLIL